MCSPINPHVDDEKVRKAEPLSKEEHHYYQSIVVKRINIAIKSRPDFALASSMLGSYVAAPTKVNMQQTKKTLKYLNDTEELTLFMEPRTST